MVPDKKLMEQLKKKVQEELAAREIQVTEFWLEELNKIYAKRNLTLDALREEIRRLMEKMKTRVRTIKAGRL
ncbi:SlyX family protein [Thermosulfuriphilus ammonigenes]|uniref:SlyX family protein n=1 Tax=Thermosulfuriphilus ammonigenes TaxID=1936021 RepID=A0A6G7PV42_9BACT|nr:SlyX family protein [Thermosulfuriphilus ammonigenes]MBA2848386.1 putative coiled-coil protein SlyX [Thermosulfuriphilus ammonigenes]QIJ71457.1 SlyX family protein [Thermosulfuriphilus ammonigenes]